MARRWAFALVSTLLIMVLHVAGSAKIYAKSVARLNVLFIVVDDLRPQLGVYGNTQMISPNMDALANDGVLFERAYIQQATCAPSRASILTGLRPDSTGIYDLETPVREVLPDITTLPQHFKNNGYETISIGKVYHHTEDDPQGWSRPASGAEPVRAKRGYQTAEARAIAAVNSFGPPYESADVPDNAYADGENTDSAIRVLREMKAQGKPFFLAMGYHKPHLPFTAPTKYWDLYSPAAIQLAPNPFQPEGMAPFSLTPWGELRRWYGMPKGSDPMPDDEAKRLIHGYYAATSYTDAQVGRLLAELDRLGLSENTIVVLFGDHGWKLGDHGAWSKHSNFEIDTRVPFMLRTPEMVGGRAESGTRVNALVELVDLYPTLCELAGLTIPDHVQGESLVPLLEDPDGEGKGYALSQFPRSPAKGGNAFVNLDQYGLRYEMLGEGIMGYGLRVDRYRYVEWFALSGDRLYPARPFLGLDVPTQELYDHQNDPSENVNLVHDPAYVEIADQLEAGKHQLVVIATDESGTLHRQDTEFIVEHARLMMFEMGQRIAGLVPLDIKLSIPPEVIQRATVALVPISEAISPVEQEVYSGTSIPDTLTLDTLAFPDGAYDIAVHLTTIAGVASTSTQRVVIHNWETLEDAILPPRDSGWFGVVHQLEATDQSEGWAFAGDGSDLLFGDADRIRRIDNTDQYLTWTLPRLHDYSFTVYVDTTAVDWETAVRVDISADGVSWVETEYATRIVGRSESGWQKATIEGTLAKGVAAQHIRLTLRESRAKASDIQLGHVFLRGMR